MSEIFKEFVASAQDYNIFYPCTWFGPRICHSMADLSGALSYGDGIAFVWSSPSPTSEGLV